MAKTRNDIAKRALRRLGVITEGAEASAWQLSQATDGYDTAHTELAHLGIAYWTSDSVPEAAAGPLSLYVAGEVADQFVSEERSAYFEARMQTALKRLTAITSKADLSGQPIEVDTF